MTRNCYEVLGISQNATANEIKEKYRELAHRFHPDCAEDKELAHIVFPQLQAAYGTLSDPVRRAEYDARLGENMPALLPTSLWSTAEPKPAAPPSHSGMIGKRLWEA